MRRHGVLAVMVLGLLLATLIAKPACAQAPRSIVGQWLTENKGGIIQIEAAPDGSFEGRIAGGSDPGRLDPKNPDPALRNRLLMGQVIIRGLRYDGDGKWSGGSVYDSDNGSTYRCSITLLGPDRIKLRGFIGISLFGLSQVWTRYQGERLAPAAN